MQGHAEHHVPRDEERVEFSSVESEVVLKMCRVSSLSARVLREPGLYWKETPLAEWPLRLQ